jgi:hypothetical protein
MELRACVMSTFWLRLYETRMARGGLGVVVMLYLNVIPWYQHVTSTWKCLGAGAAGEHQVDLHLSRKNIVVIIRKHEYALAWLGMYSMLFRVVIEVVFESE